MDRNYSKYITRIITVFLFSLFLLITVFPQEAKAEESYVQLGGKYLINDNSWHSWNSNSPSVNGWTAGSYLLTKDSSVLYIKDLAFSSNQDGVDGIHSDKSLKIIAQGNSSITSKRDGILVLDKDDDGSLSISGNGSSNLTVTSTAENNSQAIMAFGSGSFDSIKLTSTCQNDEYGVFYTGDLAITNSTVNASSLSAGTFAIKDSSVRVARYLYANESTGTSSISQSQVIAYNSVNIFNPLEIKDNAPLT